MTEAWDGYPEGRDADGWHWIGYLDPSTSPGVVLWDAANQTWGVLWRPPKFAVGAGWRYLGPCALPGEDRAAWLAGFEAAREGAANWLREKAVRLANANCATLAEEWHEFSAAIRAMEPPKETQG